MYGLKTLWVLVRYLLHKWGIAAVFYLLQLMKGTLMDRISNLLEGEKGFHA